MSQTSERYSKALFELAREQNCLEAVQDAMTEIKKLIVDLKDFRLFLSNPLLSYEERCAVLEALFKGKIPELFFRFLLFITYKGRLNILKEMGESFDSMYLSSTGQLRAYVKTAFPVNEQDKEFIDRHLRDKFNQKMITKWVLDPGLLGGFRIFAQGKLYDYSFRDQLDDFLQHSIKPV